MLADFAFRACVYQHGELERCMYSRTATNAQRRAIRYIKKRREGLTRDEAWWETATRAEVKTAQERGKVNPMELA